MSEPFTYKPPLSRQDRAEQAYDQLSRALAERGPECDGVDLFTADRLTRADIEVLKPICAACDVALLCRQYAKIAKLKHGYWAGRNYGETHKQREAA